eukprot:gene386-1781_t
MVTWAASASALLVVTCALLTGVLGAPEDVAFTAVADWVISNGGMVKATVGYNSEGVRGLYTTERVLKGEKLATIPGATILNSGSLNVLMVLREMYTPGSRFQTYFDYMPKKGEINNLCTFNEEYLPMMSFFMAKHVTTVQSYMRSVLNMEVQEQLEYTISEVIGNINITFEYLQYVCALTSTRYVASHERERLLLVPIYDLGNHHRTCPTLLTEYDRANEISMVAGEDLQPGDEIFINYSEDVRADNIFLHYGFLPKICNNYGDDLRADHTFLHYGFLPEVEDPPLLLAEDHHLFDEETYGVTVNDDAFYELRLRRKIALAYEIDRLNKDLESGAVASDEAFEEGGQYGNQHEGVLITGKKLNPSQRTEL